MAGSRGFGAALGVPETYRVLIVTKEEVSESNSQYAQGGIAGVLDPEDRFDNHIADTIAAGKGLCDPEVVEMVVREAPTRIGELIAWGTRSTRTTATWLSAAKADTPTRDRARPGRRNRPGNHARDHPENPIACQYPHLAE